MILRAARHPWKAVAAAVCLSLLVFGGMVAWTNHQLSLVVRPMFDQLATLSTSHQEDRSFTTSGWSWHGVFQFREERLNQQGQSIIKRSLQSAGWNVEQEGNVVLGDGLVGGFYLIATHEDHVLYAHLPKSGAELKIAVAGKGQPEVSPSPDSLRISGR